MVNSFVSSCLRFLSFFWSHDEDGCYQCGPGAPRSHASNPPDGDRWNNPSHKGAIFHHLASDALEKQCWGAKGLGCSLLTRTSTRPCSRFSYIMDLEDCTMKLLQDRQRRTFQRIHKISLHDLTESAKISTRERSDTRKVPRGLRERYHMSNPSAPRTK